MKAILLLLALLYYKSGQAQYERTEPSFGLQSTNLYKKLYTDSTHQIFQNFIVRNKDNEAYILGLATNFYNGLSK
jgi:hypothetical protein